MSSTTKTAPIPLSSKRAGRADPAAKTACIRTFGCQMNVHDSDRIRRMIQDAGYAEVQAYEDADLVILNTCYVRENAVDRVKGHLGELNRLRREGRVKKVALTGCIGAAEESAALKQTYDIDLVLGTHNTYELAQFVGLPTMQETYTPELPGTEGGHNAFVTIMTGCNYQCSYCIVPTVRGRMICRPMGRVIGGREPRRRRHKLRYASGPDGGRVETRGQEVLRTPGGRLGERAAGMVYDEPPFQHGRPHAKGYGGARYDCEAASFARSVGVGQDAEGHAPRLQGREVQAQDRGFQGGGA